MPDMHVLMTYPFLMNINRYGLSLVSIAYITGERSLFTTMKGIRPALHFSQLMRCIDNELS